MLPVMGMYVGGLSTLLGQKSVSPMFLSNSAVLQGVLTRKKEAAKRILLQYVPTFAEALLLLPGTPYMSNCMHERHLQTKLH